MAVSRPPFTGDRIVKPLARVLADPNVRADLGVVGLEPYHLFDQAHRGFWHRHVR
jgi:hypothetical protein